MMSQTEVIRPENLGISNQSFSFCDSPDVAKLVKLGLSETVKLEIVESLENGFFPNLGLNDETLEMIQDQFCLLYTSPSPRDTEVSRMPSSA